MPSISKIFIESTGSDSWRVQVECPRKNTTPGTKNMFCPHKDQCILPDILLNADDQIIARKTIQQLKLPQCLDDKIFLLPDQKPQRIFIVPKKEVSDLVIIPKS